MAFVSSAKSVVRSLALLTSGSFACPDLSGDYTSAYSNGKFSITQDGCRSLTIDEMVYIADAAPRPTASGGTQTILFTEDTFVQTYEGISCLPETEGCKVVWHLDGSGKTLFQDVYISSDGRYLDGRNYDYRSTGWTFEKVK